MIGAFGSSSLLHSVAVQRYRGLPSGPSVVAVTARRPHIVLLLFRLNLLQPLLMVVFQVDDQF